MSDHGHAPTEAPDPAAGPRPDTRFQKGRSGNPRGRPRKNRSTEPAFDLKGTLREALDTTVKVTIGGRTRSLKASEVGIRTLVTQYAKGDRHARRDLLALAQRAGIDLLGENRQLVEDVLSRSHQDILDDYFYRRQGSVAAKRDIASPELTEGL